MQQKVLVSLEVVGLRQVLELALEPELQVFCWQEAAQQGN